MNPYEKVVQKLIEMAREEKFSPVTLNYWNDLVEISILGFGWTRNFTIRFAKHFHEELLVVYLSF